MMHALLMAGGQGTRLWPVSRKNQPKQLLKFIGNKTLLQTTFDRLRKGFPADRIFVATTNRYASQIRKQLPQIPLKNYSLETEVKDRGPAIALAALLINHAESNSSLITSWSDHYIKDEASYLKTLREAEKHLKTDPDTFITIGIKPAYPHTGFGYIEAGKKVTQNIFVVKRFTEKPELKLAEKFVKSGKFLWNTGYFACNTKTLLGLYQKHQPEIFKVLMKIKPFLGTKNQQKAINRFYPQMPKVDIEKGIIEKLKNVTVIPANFDWADIGSWAVIKDVLSKEGDNLHHGLVESINSSNTLIYNHENKLVAGVGLKDLIIINTKDALLIANKHHSELIKDLVNKLKNNKKLNRYL
jgi:mannose-1-phosphate guanylyltransferase